jgi:hypothetical protein
MNRVFPVFCALPIMLIGIALGGCTSDPYAPINQSTPIRQMDDAFDPSGSRYYQQPAPAPYRRGGYDSPSYSRY